MFFRYLKEGLLFVGMLALTIGAKEFFRDSGNNLYVPWIVASLSVMSGLVLIPHLMQKKSRFKGVILFSVFFYALLIVSASTDGASQHYGMEKAYLGLLLPLTTGIIVSRYRWDEDRVLGYIILFSLAVLVVAILYKLNNGFFNRQVKYGLLGPIPFGWVCGMGAIAALFRTNRSYRTLSVIALLLLAVLWSGSKGPLSAFVLVGLLRLKVFLGKTWRERVLALSLLLIGWYAISGYMDVLRVGDALQALFSNADEYVEGKGAGSVGVRMSFFDISIRLFDDNPVFGVGFGAWSTNANGLHRYPHNIFLEIGSETGVVGLVVLLILLYLVRGKGRVSFLGYFFIACLMFSGDFSYFRYSFFLLIVGEAIYRQNAIKQIMYNKKELALY
jgi:O-antigen ligase